MVSREITSGLGSLSNNNMTPYQFISERYPIQGESPILLNHFGRKARVLEMFRECDFKVGAEIGTDTGLYAREICEKVPGVKLFCIDPWLAYTEADVVKDQDTADQLYQDTIKRLSPYDCEILRKTSMEAVKDFQDNSLDFVFIDGNHEYSFVLEDIQEWTKKVKPGGIVYGHDYTPSTEKKYGIIEAIQKYTKDNDLEWFVLHVPGRKDKASFVDCYMFIKP